MSRFLDINDVRSFVKDWNFKYPVDRWWRDRYNIPFGSPQHLDQSLLDMRIAFEEEMYHKKLEIENFNEEVRKNGGGKYQPGRGAWLKKQPKSKKMDSDEVDKVFDRALDNLDNIKNLASTEGGKMKIRI